MSWTDRIAVENILKLKREFRITHALETGTFKGVNAELYSMVFEHVTTSEVNHEYFKQAIKRLSRYPNVLVLNKPSTECLNFYWWNYIFVYLDAHFYDPALKQKWVVIDELKALADRCDTILCIHDFDNGMGHLVYDGEHLDWKLLEPYLRKVNPNFHYYVNTECDPYTEETIKYLPITVDEDVLDAIRFVHSTPQREQRGMLFCTPSPIKDLSIYKLREL